MGMQMKLVGCAPKDRTSGVVGMHGRKEVYSEKALAA